MNCSRGVNTTNYFNNFVQTYRSNRLEKTIFFERTYTLEPPRLNGEMHTPMYLNIVLPAVQHNVPNNPFTPN